MVVPIPGHLQCLLFMLAAELISSVVEAQDFERPTIEYSQATPENCISLLQKQIEGGTSELVYSPDKGYLPSVLAALNVPHESQMLVFSKTSLQRHRISPKSKGHLLLSAGVGPFQIVTLLSQGQ